VLVFDAVVSNTKPCTLSSKDHFSKELYTADDISLPVPNRIFRTPRSCFPFGVETIIGRRSTFS